MKILPLVKKLSLLLAILSIAVPAYCKLPANIMLDNGAVSNGVTLFNMEGGNIVLSEKGKTAKLTLPAEKIQEIEFIYGETVVQGVNVAQEGKWQEAADALKPQVDEMLPFLVVENTNAAPVLDTYTQALYELGNLDEFEKVYEKTTKAGDEELAQSSKAWIGYLRARKGEIDKMEEIFSALGELDKNRQAFALREVAYSYYEMSKNNTRKAIDHIAKVVASGSLESRIYPEAMFLSAKCYDLLAEEQQLRLKEERELELQRALQAERVRVARIMQQEARDQNKEQPTEEEILAAVDKEKVEDEVGPLPKITESQYHQAAQRVYLLIELFYPKSEWGTESTELITKATRDGTTEKQWTTQLSETAPAASADGQQPENSGEQTN